jgi:spermidine synthase
MPRPRTSRVLVAVDPLAALCAAALAVLALLALLALLARRRALATDRFSQRDGDDDDDGRHAEDREQIVYSGSSRLYKTIEVRALGARKTLWVDGERLVRAGDRAANEIFVHFAVRYAARRDTDGGIDKVLIVGDVGGDALREVMKYQATLKRVVVVQADEQLSLLSETHFGASRYTDAVDGDGPAIVEFMYGADIMATLAKRLMTERDLRSFDLVVVNVSGTSGPTARAARRPALYRELRSLMTDAGVLARAGDGDDSVALLAPLFQNTLVFNDVPDVDATAPTTNTHVLASRSPLPPDPGARAARRWARQGLPVRHYAVDQHAAYASPGRDHDASSGSSSDGDDELDRPIDEHDTPDSYRHKAFRAMLK